MCPAAKEENRTRNILIINRLGPAVVHQKKDRAVVELPSTTTRQIQVNGEEAVLDSYMRLIYRVECREGIWKIADLCAINEFDTLQPLIAGTDLHINPEHLKGLRSSYRFLAYTRNQAGGKERQDLYGIDRHEEVDALYAEAFAWLEGGERAC